MMNTKHGLSGRCLESLDMSKMHPARYLLCCFSFIPLILTCSSIAAAVDLHQTIPPDGLACPNDTLQFICTSPGDALIIVIGSSPAEQFMEFDFVNATLNFGDFVAVLVAQNETTISATITKEMVTSSDSGLTILCAGGSSIQQRLIMIADGPANCSSMSLDTECHINAENGSEAQVLITLTNNGSLMCVVGYLIQFNGKNITVPVSSPSAEFPIPITEGEPFDYEITVYTLDYENRTGQVPCFFTTANVSCTTGGFTSTVVPASSGSTPSINSSPSPSVALPTSGAVIVLVVVVVVVLLLLLVGLSVLILMMYIYLLWRKHRILIRTLLKTPSLKTQAQDRGEIQASNPLSSLTAQAFVETQDTCIGRAVATDSTSEKHQVSPSRQDTAPGNGTPEKRDLSRKMSDNTSSAVPSMQETNPGEGYLCFGGMLLSSPDKYCRADLSGEKDDWL